MVSDAEECYLTENKAKERLEIGISGFSAVAYGISSSCLAAVETVSHKGTNSNQDVPSECHHAGICDSKRDSGGLASKEKVIFILKLLGPILPVHSHRFHKRNI